jgi:hypothetical protein
VSRLSKRDVERLLDDYDADPVASLTRALGRVLDRPEAGWTELVTAAPVDGARRAALLAREAGALDELARELNEVRDLAPGGGRPTERSRHTGSGSELPRGGR